MTDLLQEFCDSRGLTLRVDRQAGVIRGIKILGPRSRNGRDYLQDALARAVGLYEGAKVNVNHAKGHPLAPRDYQERIGVIRNVAHRAGEGLFADFHFNPKHYLSEQLVWDAVNAPENVGFSHNVQARTRRQGETTLVEEILQVHSVDLVADPATTRGLFEDCSVADERRNVMVELADGANHPIAETENVGSEKLHPVLNVDAKAQSEQHPDAIQKLCQEQAAEIATLRTEIDQLRARAAAESCRALVQSLLAEYRLPNPDSSDSMTKTIVSDSFLQSLLTAPEEREVRRLIVERVARLGNAKSWQGDQYGANRRPVSRDQIVLDPHAVCDGRSFAKAIAG